MTRTPPDSPIFMTCPEGGFGDALCVAMIEALRRAAPDRAVQKIQEIGHEDALRVTLHVDRQDDHTIAAHLEWQGTGTTNPRIGPVLSFDVQDALLRATMMPDFADMLVRHGGLPLSEH